MTGRDVLLACAAGVAALTVGPVASDTVSAWGNGQVCYQGATVDLWGDGSAEAERLYYAWLAAHPDALAGECAPGEPIVERPRVTMRPPAVPPTTPAVVVPEAAEQPVVVDEPAPAVRIPAAVATPAAPAPRQLPATGKGDNLTMVAAGTVLVGGAFVVFGRIARRRHARQAAR